MEQSKVNQILRVAKMYYELKMSQQDIGAKENISKSTVSRLLKNAMDEGFVEVRIRQPHYALADLEAEFTNRFGIRKVVIAADVVENRGVEPETAVDMLWDSIFKATRADQDDPIAAWHQFNKSFEDKTRFLNNSQFVKFIYKNSLGTDIEVGMPENHIWAAEIFSSLGKSSFGVPLNLKAPWLVPMVMARESQPVLSTNSTASSGSVKEASWSPTFTASSMPASFPSSASTTTP